MASLETRYALLKEQYQSLKDRVVELERINQSQALRLEHLQRENDDNKDLSVSLAVDPTDSYQQARSSRTDTTVSDAKRQQHVEIGGSSVSLESLLLQTRVQDLLAAMRFSTSHHDCGYFQSEDQLEDSVTHAAGRSVDALESGSYEDEEEQEEDEKKSTPPQPQPGEAPAPPTSQVSVDQQRPILRGCKWSACAERAHLSQSWQFVSEHLCFYSHGGVSEPGYLLMFLNTAVFVYIGDARSRGKTMKRFPISSLCGVALSYWGMLGSPALHFSLQEDQQARVVQEAQRKQQELNSEPHLPQGLAGVLDYVTVEAPDPDTDLPSSDHILWGFEGGEHETQHVAECIATSILQASAAQPPSDLSSSVGGDGILVLSYRVLVEVYEVERYLSPVLGWSSKFLLPTDPAKWTDKDARLSYTREDIGRRVPSSWEWQTNWDIHTGVIAVVESIVPASPAHLTGLQPHDVIVGFRTAQHIPLREPTVDYTDCGVTAVQTFSQFLVALAKPGAIELTVFRPYGSTAGIFATSETVPSKESFVQSTARGAWLVLYLDLGDGVADGGRGLGLTFVRAGSQSVLQGWEYAPSFAYGGDTEYTKEHCVGQAVRRRRWIREADVSIAVSHDGMNGSIPQEVLDSVKRVPGARVLSRRDVEPIGLSSHRDLDFAFTRSFSAAAVGASPFDNIVSTVQTRALPQVWNWAATLSKTVRRGAESVAGVFPAVVRASAGMVASSHAAAESNAVAQDDSTDETEMVLVERPVR